MNEFLVVVTMDCEKPNDSGNARVSGPPSWSDSERFISGYVSVAEAFGHPVSFFIHPEVAKPHAELFLSLEARGCNIDGLHLHPWKYRPDSFRSHFGHLVAEEQLTLVRQATEDYRAAFARRPRYFRPGTFSANDATASTLVELGFIGGSLSVPGRIFPDLGAVWAGCPADPHLMDGAFRMSPGSLPFANMPLTVDLSQTRKSGPRVWHPDLRPDQNETDFPGLVERIVTQIIERDPPIKVINIVTHNDNDYSDPQSRVRGNFAQTLRSIARSCEAHGLSHRGATIAQLCSTILEQVPAKPEFVYV